MNLPPPRLRPLDGPTPLPVVAEDGVHAPVWETQLCCGGHPEALVCEFCAGTWPCGPARSIIAALESIMSRSLDGTDDDDAVKALSEAVTLLRDPR